MLGQVVVLVGAAVPGQATGLVGGVVLGQATVRVADVALGRVLARVARLAGPESRVRLVGITTMHGAAHPLVGEQKIPVVEAYPITKAQMLVQTAVDLLAETSLPHIAPRHPKVGAGIRRPKQRSMKLVVARLKGVAKTESDFRKCFRGWVSRRVVRLRTGFEPGVSVSTAS
jgi:hypothetical protein